MAKTCSPAFYGKKPKRICSRILPRSNWLPKRPRSSYAQKYQDPTTTGETKNHPAETRYLPGYASEAVLPKELTESELIMKKKKTSCRAPKTVDRCCLGILKALRNQEIGQNLPTRLAADWTWGLLPGFGSQSQSIEENGKMLPICFKRMRRYKTLRL